MNAVDFVIDLMSGKRKVYHLSDAELLQFCVKFNFYTVQLSELNSVHSLVSEITGNWRGYVIFAEN